MDHHPRGPGGFSFADDPALADLVLASSPQPCVLLRLDGTLLDLNSSAEQVFGFSRAWARGRKFAELMLHPSEIASFGEWLDASRSSSPPGPESFSVAGRAADGSRMELEATLSVSSSGVVVAFLQDVSDLRDAQDVLRESQDRFRKLFKDGPVGIALVAPDLQVITANEALGNLLGFAQEELEQLRLASITHPDDVLLDQADFKNLFGGSLPGYTVEKRLIAKDGHLIWTHVNASIVSDPSGAPLYALLVVEDISERKAAEEELRRTLVVLQRTDQQRRELLARLVDAQEAERRAIAADIHDDSVQIMAAAAIRLERLAGQLTDPAQVKMLNELLDTVRHSIERLRVLLFELTPTVLDHEGLVAAVKAKLDDLTEEMGVRYDIRNGLKGEPGEHAKVIAYRIISEVLTNIRKHSDAQHVEVKLNSADAGLFVRVTDDGHGFEEVPGEYAGHLGLSSIRERASVAGGWSRVVSAIGRGTTVEFWVPDTTSQGDLDVLIDVSDPSSKGKPPGAR